MSLPIKKLSKNYSIRILSGLLLAASTITAHAQEGYWQSPSAQSASAALEGGAEYTAYSSYGETQYERNFGTLNEREAISSFSMTQAFSDTSQFGVSHARGIYQDNTILGFTHNKLSLSYMHGSGENFTELAGQYNGIDPYVFRAGFNQKFRYSGYAADYSLGKLGHLQYGEATVRSNGLLDRKAQYIQWAGRTAYARVSEFNRGSERVGNGFDLGFSFDNNKQLGFQAMELDNDRSLQRIRLAFDGKRSRQYWFDLTSHRNALYRDNDDVSVMFTFKTSLGPKLFSSFDDEGEDEIVTEAPTDQEAAGAQAPKKKKRSMAKNLLWIGAGVVAAASGSSSGSEQVDTVLRFRSKQDAAFDVLNRFNPMSVDENREYGGWVFQASDGSFGSSAPAVGDQSSVTLPNPNQSNPTGSVLAATYHTHGAFHRRFDNENFSPQDIENDELLGIDGYLATPAGLFKWHNVTTGQIITIGPIAN